jgi:hypothetical protein
VSVQEQRDNNGGGFLRNSDIDTLRTGQDQAGACLAIQSDPG